jgi:hypothetical protein
MPAFTLSDTVKDITLKTRLSDDALKRVVSAIETHLSEEKNRKHYPDTLPTQEDNRRARLKTFLKDIKFKPQTMHDALLKEQRHIAVQTNVSSDLLNALNPVIEDEIMLSVLSGHNPEEGDDLPLQEMAVRCYALEKILDSRREKVAIRKERMACQNNNSEEQEEMGARLPSL